MSSEISPEWWQYLGEQKVGRLATADADGKPHVTPLWYVVHDDAIYIGTQRSRKKLRNIQQNNRVSFCVDSGESEYEYRGIIIEGHMELVDDPDFHDFYRECLIQRYYGTKHHQGYQYVRSLPAPQLMRLLPEKVITWDFGASVPGGPGDLERRVRALEAVNERDG